MDGRASSLVVVGASAGGVEGLRRIAAGLPADLPAAVGIVLHVSPNARSRLPQILARAGLLVTARRPEADGPQQARSGRVVRRLLRASAG